MTAAVLALPDHDVAGCCAVRLGERVEADVDAVRSAFGEEAAARVLTYWDAACALWRDGKGPAIVIARTLTRATQKDSKAGRLELSEELAALEQLRGGAEMVEALLAPSPDMDALSMYAPGAEGNETHITITRRAADWPAVLGGAPTPAELRRHVRLTANHSKWRDRKVRRLVRVEVTAEEVWPDPSRV
jgi:hypothetical protein